MDSVTLVAGLRARDAACWEELYRRAYPKLLAYARRRLAGIDDAREAVSETMTRAVAGVDRWAGDGAGIDAWLYGILRHVVLDAQRRAGRRRRLPLTTEIDHADAADGMLADAEAASVRAAFARLRPDEQEILELRVVGDLSADDVANVLGRRPGAVRMAQSRALAHLRQLMAEGDSDGR